MDGSLIIFLSQQRIGVGEVELPVTPQDVPSFGVAGLQRGATLDDFELAGMDAVVGEPESRGLIAKEYPAGESQR